MGTELLIMPSTHAPLRSVLLIEYHYIDELSTVYSLVGKPEGKRTLGRPWRRLEDNIRMDPREIGKKGVDLIHLAQDRYQSRAVVNTVVSLRIP
jgi:hypothetical protein